MALQTLKSELTKAEKSLKGFGKDLPGQIDRQINKAWTPALKESAGELRSAVQGALPRYFDIPYASGGTSQADVSPQYKLQEMGRGLGDIGGDIAYASDYSRNMGANVKDMYNKALQAAQMGYGMASDAYSRKFNEYQLAFQQANRGGGGGGINIEDLKKLFEGQEDPQGAQMQSLAHQSIASGDWEGLAGTLERWGSHISPEGWEAMNPQARQMMEQYWEVAQEGRWKDPRRAIALASNYGFLS